MNLLKTDFPKMNIMQNTTFAMNIKDDHFHLGSAAARKRQQVLAQALADSTMAFLKKIQFRNGMQGLDLGCKTGEVTRILNSLIGNGNMTGIDMSATNIQIAREIARQNLNKSNIEYRHENIPEWSEKQCYNFVYSRLLFNQLREPLPMLRQIINSLKTGGIAMVEDLDFSQLHCFPNSFAFDRFVELYIAMKERYGTDANIGNQLSNLFRQAGFSNIQVQLARPTFLTGESKKIASLTLESIAANLLEEKLTTSTELQALLFEIKAFEAQAQSMISLPGNLPGIRLPVVGYRIYHKFKISKTWGEPRRTLKIQKIMKNNMHSKTCFKLFFTYVKFIFLILFLTSGLVLNAQTTRTWLGAAGNQWSIPVNWSPFGVPGPTDNVIIPNNTNNIDPVIFSVVAVKSVEVRANGYLTILDGATLEVDGATGDGILNNGQIDNFGILKIGVNSNVNHEGILNNNIFNNDGGTIIVEYTGFRGIHNDGDFENKASGNIFISQLSGNIGDNGIENGGTFTNNDASIDIDRVGDDAIYNSSGSTFSNESSGQLLIGQIGSIPGEAIENAGGFTNFACATIHIFSDNSITNNANFTNNGIIIENATGNSNISDNNGGIQNLNGGIFTITTNNGVVTKNTSGKIWTGCLSGDWHNDANWHDGVKPVPANDALIPKTAPNNATVPAPDITIRSITVGMDAQLDISNGRTLNIAGALADGILNRGSIINAGTINVGNTGAFIGRAGIENKGYFENTTTAALTVKRIGGGNGINNSGTFKNSSNIVIGDASNTLSIEDGGIQNKGDFDHLAGTIMVNNTGFGGIGIWPEGNFTNEASIVIGNLKLIEGYGLSNAGDLPTNQGEVSPQTPLFFTGSKILPEILSMKAMQPSIAMWVSPIPEEQISPIMG